MPARPLTRPRSARHAVPVVLALVALVALGACGDDAADTSSASTAGTSSSTAAPSSSTSTTSTTAPGRALGEALEVTPLETPTTTAPDGSVAVTSLAVGDCADVVGADGLESVEVVEARVLPCEEGHAIEVFAVASLDDEPSSPYPGDDAVLRAADEACLAAFAPYVGIDYVDSTLEIVHLRPDEPAWQRQDRTVLCAIVDPTGAPLVGSVAGSAR